jgi:hypothetical protein
MGRFCLHLFVFRASPHTHTHTHTHILSLSLSLSLVFSSSNLGNTVTNYSPHLHPKAWKGEQSIKSESIYISPPGPIDFLKNPICIGTRVIVLVYYYTKCVVLCYGQWKLLDLVVWMFFFLKLSWLDLSEVIAKCVNRVC